MEILLTAILCLLLGFFGRTMYDYVKGTFDMLTEKFDSHKAGVVQPSVSRMTKSQPIDLSKKTSGVIPRPSPNQVLLNAQLEREKRLKQNG